MWVETNIISTFRFDTSLSRQLNVCAFLAVLLSLIRLTSESDHPK
jgi:hypothetical protein